MAMATEVHHPAQRCGSTGASAPHAHRDPACLLWLGGRAHVCRAESGVPLEADGASCASWDRVRLARYFAAANAHNGQDQAVAAMRHTQTLLAEMHCLLVSAAPLALTNEHLATTWSSAASAFLRADQAVTLAGWHHPAQ